MSVCLKCYKASLPSCQVNLIVKPTSGLNPGQNYLAVIKDKFDKEYGSFVEADLDGYINIPFEDFEMPAGSRTPYSGTYVLEFRLVPYNNNKSVPIYFCANQYKCIELSFYEQKFEQEIQITCSQS